ncbi:pentatricopeptide repeat-containing protein [Populus alba x Populus x berolinensis]|uniref:Pentatricopeptide repeat-containing protein n=1 Tax=Populus alba x Populus x berolinensis TaxID=444605 RepID=A0AAD6R462_9ROSI|nr:pentatricopeptide repeat-containing protein [Populus alba x Populus x berolinensis]
MNQLLSSSRSVATATATLISSLTFQSLKQFSSTTTTKPTKWNSPTNTIITHPILLAMESCTSMLQLKQIQAHMTKTALITHTFPVSRVLAFCALSDSGDINHAHLLFSQLQYPNTYIWNTMIRGYSKAKMGQIGFLFFCQMVQKGVEMDCRSFVFALKACEQSLEVLEGKSVHCVVWKMGFVYTLLVQNGLVHFYGLRGCLGLARQVFDEISERDVVSWTSMIDGYSKHKWFDEALKLFDSMLMYGGVEPNEVTMIAVLSSCSQKGDLILGKTFHEYVKTRNVTRSLNLMNAILDMYVKCGCLDSAREIFDTMGEAAFVPMENTLACVLPVCGQLGCLDVGQWIHRNYVRMRYNEISVILANALIDMYAKCGVLHEAAKVFNDMPERNLVSWNSMITAYASHGHAKQALNVFEQMISGGFKPDDITLVGVLSACSHGGLVAEGREYFQNMKRKYGIEPKNEHYACMIDLLGRVGLLEDAYELITKMPMEPSAAAWGALVHACRMHGNVEVAKIAAPRLLELDPEDSGIYVLLANIWANGRRWGDVKMARRMMRERRVKKIPGRSIVEVEGQFHEFLAGDESHPQSEGIYNALDQLFAMSKLEGLF